MKYIKQFGIIIIISFLGELLSKTVPLPIPATIYGIVIMLSALMTKVIPLSEVKESAEFLLDIMAILFIPAGVGMITSWSSLQDIIIPLIITIISTTILVMAVTGKVTQTVLRHEKRKKNEQTIN